MEKISAWMDGECGREECAALVRQSASGTQREAWELYHLIGEALRGELNDRGCAVGTSRALTARICEAIAAEPNVLVPAAARAVREGEPKDDAQASSKQGWFVKVGNGAPVWKPWLMAVSVATVAVAGWQAITTDWRRDASGAVAAARAPVSATSASALAPVIATTSAAISYDRYLQAHDEAAPTTRLSGPRVYLQAVNYGRNH